MLEECTGKTCPHSGQCPLCGHRHICYAWRVSWQNPSALCEHIYVTHDICLQSHPHGDTYTEDAGLPYFDRATVIANGTWLCGSALKSMGAKLCSRSCLINIGPSYT